MKFKAKIINTAYDMSTILSFAFSIDFFIIYRNMTFINKLILLLWMAITGKGVLKIVLNRILLNKTNEDAFEKALSEVKNVFSGNQYATTIYMLFGMTLLSVRIAIPFIIAL